jgi:acetoin utilization protein AcuB
MNVRELMTSHPICISASSPVREAVEMLRDLDIRHLPVVDDENCLVGMVSDRDLRGLSIPVVGDADYQGQLYRTLDAPVSAVMSAGLVTVEPEDDVTDAIDLMIEHKVGAVPVVDPEGDELVGIVSYVDVLRRVPTNAFA